MYKKEKSGINKTIHFVLCCDCNYISQAGVTIFSIIANLSQHYNSYFHIFAYDFSVIPDEWKCLTTNKKANIEIIYTKLFRKDFTKLKQSSFINKWISMSTYDRLLMFSMLDKSIELCFYIDSDIIVNCDLSTLYESFDKNKLIAAVAEIHAIKYTEKYYHHLFSIDDFKNFCKNPLSYPYFNAGFFIANIRLCKKYDVYNQLINYLTRYPDTKLADQDALNAIFSQRFAQMTYYLDPKYNVFSAFKYKKEMDTDYFYSKEQIFKAIKNPQIIHFGGENKPWNYFNVKYSKIYYKYWQLSGLQLKNNYSQKIKNLFKTINRRFSKILRMLFD